MSRGNKLAGCSADISEEIFMKKTIVATTTLILMTALGASAQTSGSTGQGTSSQNNGANPSGAPLPPGLEKRDQLPPGLSGGSELPPGLGSRTNQFGTV